MTVPAQEFVTGWRKRLLYLRVALHVLVRACAAVAGRRMELRQCLPFLRRALVFLGAVRHSKVVRRGGLRKLHLYVPAYPSPAFWHALEKLYRPDPGPISVVLSMTRACSYRCPHCYQQRDGGEDLTAERLTAAARSMQDLGVSLFDIEGGEPLRRFRRLLGLLKALDERSELWLNTTGAGLRPEMVQELAAAGLRGAMVSLHSPEARDHDAFTGVEGSFDVACHALRSFAAAGLFTAINCCPRAGLLKGDGLEGLLELGRDLGCSCVQFIHAKASGGWLGRGGELHPHGSELAKLSDLHARYNAGGCFRHHPAVSAQVREEGADLFGCTAGGVDRFYVGASGEVQPCEFLNLSFGSLREESFEVIYRRMREAFAVPCSDWLCCTQAERIAAAVESGGLKHTPVPWELAREIVAGWDRGPRTALYRRLGIYGGRP
jgi:MoaA/NifB/PqqE/SkfB family radical SAM enzyme